MGLAEPSSPGIKDNLCLQKKREAPELFFKLPVIESDLHLQSVRHLYRGIPELQGFPNWTELELLRGMATPLNTKPRVHPQGERSGGREGSTCREAQG